MKKFFCCVCMCLLVFVTIFSVSGCSTDNLKKISKNLSSYTVAAVLDEENMQLSATETVKYVNSTGGSLTNLCFHLYPRSFREDALIRPYTSLTMASCFPNGVSYGDLQISAVKNNQGQLSFSLVGEDEDILQIELPEALANGKSVELTIEFIVTIPNCTHRLGYYEGSINLGNWYPIACVYENGAFDMTPYYATGDPFFSEISNYSISLTYPSKYTLFATGGVETSEANGTKTSRSSALAVRDFAMCLSDDVRAASATVGDTSVTYVGYAGDADTEELLGLCKQAITYFSSTYGTFPYSTLTVIKTPFIYGGMEYPNIVFVSDAIDDEEELLKVIVHEIAHQWWYSVVGNNETTEAWLDESLAEYSTALFFGKNPSFGISYDDIINTALSSYLLYVDVIGTIKGEVNTKMNLPVNEYQNDYEYSYMIYVKGVIMFDSLKEAVGESKIIAGLKKYYSENKFKIATKESFFKAFKEACHTDLDSFFEGYLNGSTIITNVS